MHPQWYNAVNENGQWKLNLDYWRTPEFISQLGSKKALEYADDLIAEYCNIFGMHKLTPDTVFR
ncbi:MAG: hypothetical protein R6V10_03055, partial [bacterium]